MEIDFMKIFSVIALLACTGAAMAQVSSINGGAVEARRFNDFGTTVLAINGTSYPAPGVGAIAGLGGGVQITESRFPTGFEQPTGFANRHEVAFSNNNGASKYGFQNNESFEICFNINVSGGNTSRRKESGLFFQNPRPVGTPTFFDEGAVLVASDGEVAVFGAAQPFLTFGNVYSAGTTALLRLIYTAPGTLNAKATYRLIFTDTITGLHDSGHRLWGDEGDGTNGYNDGTLIHMFIQSQRDATINDSGNVVYSNIKLIPTPGAVALLGLGAVAGLRRRRR